MKQLWFRVLALIALTVLQVQAADIHWTNTGGVGEWNTATNWGTDANPGSGSVPGQGDTAWLVSNTDHAQVTSAFDNGTFHIVMRNNATLAISADFRTVGRWDFGVSGLQNTTVTHTAGLAIIRTLNIGNDLEARNFDAKYTFSGGTVRATTAVTIGKNGIFDVQGDGGNIQFNNGGASAVTIGEGTLSYTLGANGVSFINNMTGTGTLTIDSANSNLVIDASSYTGGAGQILLADRFGTIAGTFDASNVSITGLGNGLSAEVKYGSGRIYLDVIPEPSIAAALLGVVAGLTRCFRRRRA